jgi:hypothetical protein
MSFALMERVWELQVDAKKKLILLCFAGHHDHKLQDMVVWPSTELQIAETCISQSTLYKKRAQMLKDGWIERLYSHPAVPHYVREIYRLRPENWPSQNANQFQNANDQNEKVSQNKKPFSQIENAPSQDENSYKGIEPEVLNRIGEPGESERPSAPAATKAVNQTLQTRSATDMPDEGALLTPELVDFARQECGLDELRTKFAIAKFVDYCRSEHIKCHDWRARARNWLRREVMFADTRLQRNEGGIYESRSTVSAAAGRQLRTEKATSEAAREIFEWFSRDISNGAHERNGADLHCCVGYH